jgi:hypothetical protein
MELNWGWACRMVVGVVFPRARERMRPDSGPDTDSLLTLS